MSTAIALRMLERFVQPDMSNLSAAMSQHILGFKLSEGERSRLSTLAEKSNNGTLTQDERSEYELLVLLGELFTLVKFKARASASAIKSC